MCSLRAHIKRLFIGRLTDFDVDLKAVHQIKVCLWVKKMLKLTFG